MKSGMDITEQLYNRIVENPGISMIEAGRPFLHLTSEANIWRRLRAMKYKNRIRIEHINRTTKCYPMEATDNAG